MKLLFVCSRNRWRSPAAETLFKNHRRHEARSAGTENGARVRVTAGHIGWADIVFCMERKHADRLRGKFPAALAGKPVVVLRIPDIYPSAEDPELAARLKTALAAHLPDLWPNAPEHLPTRDRPAT